MSNITIKNLDGQERSIDWVELNQLKKDILWVFDENTSQLNASFIAEDSFKSSYWEYSTLDGDEWFSDEDKKFYRQGALIITLCMTVEYIDTASGNQQVFGATKINHIISHIENFKPINQNQFKLKSIALLGLNIADSMTENDLLNTDGYNHPDLKKFYSELDWVDSTFIKAYYKSKL